QPAVVATLQRFFDTAAATSGGGSVDPVANPNATPPSALPANPPNPPGTRPAEGPKPSAAVPRLATAPPGAKRDLKLTTNPPAAVVVTQDVAEIAGQAGARGAGPSAAPGVRASANYEFNFYFMLFQPGRHFWIWLLLLLVTVVAAFFLGWHLQRSRTKKRLSAPSAAAPAA